MILGVPRRGNKEATKKEVINIVITWTVIVIDLSICDEEAEATEMGEQPQVNQKNHQKLYQTSCSLKKVIKSF